MKTITYLITLFLFASAFNSCKKNGTSSPASALALCKPSSEYTNIFGNRITYEFAYDNDEKMTTVKKFIGGQYHVLKDSTVIGNYTVTSYNMDWPFNFASTVYNADVRVGKPTEAKVSITEGPTTQTNVYHYFFFYDNKDRLAKVREQTDNSVGDWEYDLSIIYNDQDNVTALNYEWTTGPKTVLSITALGYDDKPTPYSGVKNWYFFMNAAWNNYDPQPLFTALSKNNPLGLEQLNKFKKTFSYTYNDKGFPTERRNSETVVGTPGTFSYEQTYGYDCK